MASPNNNFSENTDSSAHTTPADQPAARISAPSRNEDVNQASILPAFLTAVVYLIFGLITVFVQEPTFTVDTFIVSGFLLALAGAHAFTAQKLRAVDGTIAQSLNSMALVLAGAAVLLVILTPATFGFILITALAIGLASILKILLGMHAKNSLTIAKDWQLEGLIMTVSAAGLAIIGELGEKAILGVLGGGAIITGVFLIIGALSLRGQSDKSAEYHRE